MVGPAQLRKAADHLKKKFNRSERSVCRAIGLARSSCRYVSVKPSDDELKTKMRDITQKYRRYGYRRIHVLIRRSGMKVNHKKIYRIYRAEGLKVERRKKKKMAAFIRMASPLPTGPNQRWSIDFVSDQFVNGNRLKILTVVDDFTKECPLIHVDTSITGIKLVELFKELGRRRPLPEDLSSFQETLMPGLIIEELSSITSDQENQLGTVLSRVLTGSSERNVLKKIFSQGLSTRR